MARAVLFVTGLGKELKRAENMYTLYKAYQGEKTYISSHDDKFIQQVNSGKYDLMVIDVFPTVKPKKAIMIWHAIQGGKYIGLDQRGTYYREEYAELMDYIITAGRGGIDMFNRCTHVPKDRIIPLGMPRTDRYFYKEKINRIPLFGAKRVYLFAPTFRNWREGKFPDIDWGMIDRQLNDDELMIVKAHPYGTQFFIRGCSHIISADKMEPCANFLECSDVIITDYSSIMFDAYLLDKPVVLFEKEQGYVRERGMYLQYPGGYCSRYTTNETDLVNSIREANGLTETERECINYVADACDGNSCERICNFIDNVNN